MVNTALTRATAAPAELEPKLAPRLAQQLAIKLEPKLPPNLAPKLGPKHAPKLAEKICSQSKTFKLNDTTTGFGHTISSHADRPTRGPTVDPSCDMGGLNTQKEDNLCLKVRRYEKVVLRILILPKYLIYLHFN